MMVCGRDYEVTTLVDEVDYQRLRLWEYKWFRLVCNNTTYIRSIQKQKTLLLHRLLLGLIGSPRKVVVDHIDHNGLNNTRSNLRITDRRGNSRNRRKQKSKKAFSDYKGVAWVGYDSKINPWKAQIWMPDRKQKSLGCYPTETEAAQAYNRAAIELFGTMAYLNDLSLPDHPCESA